MKIQYFTDTDTVYVQLTDAAVVETKDFNENTIIDLDKDGNLVAITLEHAKQLANIADFSFQHILAAQGLKKRSNQNLPHP